MEHFALERDASGNETLHIPHRGRQVLSHNMYNRGSAFTHEERKALQLEGLLPNYVTNIEEQCQRAFKYITRKNDPLEKFVGLSELEARNAVLFYRLILDHIEEFMPIVYTPTVGLACQKFSHVFRRGRGLWITPDDKGRIAELLRNAPFDDVRLIVVTDNQSILGLGDQGAGGMGIPVGKLALYTVAAGIHPTQCLPISLDVGTDNEQLLQDPLYMGWRNKRLTGQAYQEIVEEFVEGVKQVHPKAVLQWEDFRKSNAFELLDKFKDRICSFNDDIQGTAGVAVAGVNAACRISNTQLKDQRILIVGGGAAGIGIARLLRDNLSHAGLSGEELIKAIAVLDSRGLLTQNRDLGDAYKEEFAWPPHLVEQLGLGEDLSLASCVKALKPTVLIGTSGQPGTFDENIVRTMAQHVDRPIIFPFSNPNSMSEAKPDDLIRWTEGRVLIATGSPFSPVNYAGQTFKISQGNNVYIFPGIGLGAIVAEAKSISPSMINAAAKALADFVAPEDLQAGALFPPLTKIREASAQIALSVAKAAIADQVAPAADDKTLENRIRKIMWYPAYPRVETKSALT